MLVGHPGTGLEQVEPDDVGPEPGRVGGRVSGGSRVALCECVCRPRGLPIGGHVEHTGDEGDSRQKTEQHRQGSVDRE